MNKMIYFTAPDPGKFTSGGNLYNRHLFNSIQAQGQEVLFQDTVFSPTKQGDVILCDSLFLTALAEAPSAIRGQSILIVHSDSPAFYQHLSKLMESSLRFILPGQYMVDVLLEQGISAERCLLLEPGFDDPFPETVSLDQLPVKLILIANLTPDKGVLDFLKAIDRNPKVIPDAVLLDIYGDNQIDADYAAQCIQVLTTDYLNKWVTYHGVTPHDQLMRHLGDHHALLSVSPKETFGMAIREARMAGIPVLGIQGGNIPYLIQQEVDGLLFPTLERFVGYLQTQLMDPSGFLSVLMAFHPRKVSSPSWSDQARRLLSWI